MTNPTTNIDFQKIIFNLIKNPEFGIHEDVNVNDDESNEVSYADSFRKFDELLQGKHDNNLPHKSLKKSTEARQAGNLLYNDSKSHNQDIHAKILSLYTKSIAFAEENSEELALAYHDRSSFLLHLQKYQECLVDTEKAYQITKSNVLKKKLADRKQDCLSKIHKVEKDEQNPSPSLDFKPSKEIPCASELIKLEYNEKYGRHVVATQDIQPGTVIAVEKGMLLNPIVTNVYFTCSHCLSVAWNGIPCQNCTNAIYCSEKCKDDAWQQYHDIECSLLPYLDFLQNDSSFTSSIITTASQIIRLFIKIVKTEGLINILKEADIIDQNKDKHRIDYFYDKSFQFDKFQAIYYLSENDKYLETNYTLWAYIISLLHKKSKIFYETVDNGNFRILDQSYLLSTLKVLKKLGNIAVNNRYGFESNRKRNQDMEEAANFGTIICPFSSYFNHSCVSNVLRLFTKSQEILLFTSNFVPKGHQLFINYGVEISSAKEERQNYINSCYHFICDCQACEENWPQINTKDNFIIKDWDEPKNSRIFLELQKNNLSNTYIHVLQDDEDTWLFTKYKLEDVAKIINIICKYYTSREAYVLIDNFADYIVDYYDHFYGVKNDIPSNC